jgi:hypothetical protein
VNVVFLHGHDQHGAGDSAADGGRVEVGDSGGADVEGSSLQRCDALANQRTAAID